MVKYRNLAFVLVLGIITLNLYSIYWLVSTSRELRSLRTEPPDGWDLLLLFLLPIPWLAIVVVVGVLGFEGGAATFFAVVLTILTVLWLIVYLLATVAYYRRYNDALSRISSWDSDNFIWFLLPGFWSLLFFLPPFAMMFAQRHLNKLARSPVR